MIASSAWMPAPLARVVEMLEGFPGIGSKTAMRLSLHLLGRPAEEAAGLAAAIAALHEHVTFCERCGCFAERGACHFCDGAKRDRGLVCVVEQPVDVLILERSGYDGVYHVLHGRLSPVDGIGPEHLRLKSLDARVAGGEVREMILATSATVDGEATAHYLSRRYTGTSVRISRISRGVPEGSELEYLDEHTLHRAVTQRVVWDEA